MSTEYRNFLALSYDELEDLNLQAKADRTSRVSPGEVRENRHEVDVEGWLSGESQGASRGRAALAHGIQNWLK